MRALIGAGASIDVVDVKGWAPLQRACPYGHGGVVEFSSLKGARAEHGAMGQDPPLHLAATHNHLGVIEGLLSFRKVSVWRFDAQSRPGTGGVARKRCERSRVQ